MHRLRSTAVLARFVLAWFVLCVGAAMASPLVQPGAVQLVCSGGSVKLQQQDEGDAPARSLTLNCALCTPAVVPPPAVAPVPLLAQVAVAPLEHPRHGVRVVEVQRPPARGPPQRLSEI